MRTGSYFPCAKEIARSVASNLGCALVMCIMICNIAVHLNELQMGAKVLDSELVDNTHSRVLCRYKRVPDPQPDNYANYFLVYMQH